MLINTDFKVLLVRHSQTPQTRIGSTIQNRAGYLPFEGFLPPRRRCAILTPCHLTANPLSLGRNTTNKQE